MDGTDGNDPNWGAPNAFPNANWIEQIQVVSLGASAQYGEYTSARVNAITRSGSNRLSGLAEYWTTRPTWVGSNRGDLPPDLAKRFKPIELVERWDTSEQVGGPIIRDRLWFFSGFEYYKNAQRPFSLVNAPRMPDDPASRNEEPKLLVKLTGAPSPRIRLEGYIEYDNWRWLNGNIGPLVRPEALMFYEAPERMGNARLTWTLSDRTLLEARLGTYAQHQTNGPTSPDLGSGPPGHYDRFTGVSSVNFAYLFDYRPRTAIPAVTLTRHVDGFAGRSHELKGGFEYHRASLLEASAYTGGALYEDFNGEPDIVRFWDGDTHDTSFWRASAFLQDTWLVNDRLTIEPGVRFGLYDGVSPASGAPAYKNHSISPRLGAAWDLGANHRTVLRAHYGWYHDPMVTSLYDLYDYLLNTSPTVVAKVLGPGQFQEVSRSGGPGSLAGLVIDPNAKHSYAEEYLVGIERELWPRFSLRAQYVRRNFKRSLGYINTGTPWTPADVVDPGPDGLTSTADDGRTMTVYYNEHPRETFLVLTNPSNAWRHYNGFQFIGTRRYAQGWEVEASYTWSRTKGSFDNWFSSSASQAQLSHNGIGVNPNWNLFRTGRTDLDRTHDVKVLATYRLPYWGGVRVSGVYRFASGTRWARGADFGPLVNLCCGFVRVEPLSHELPATNTLDLRLEKTVPIGATTVGVFADVFNITNQGIPGRVNFQSGPNFGLPTNWSDPRMLRVGARLTF